ncbi:Oidioi.mRNA.OKI2018_I69.PAR.g11410.t1.cds [Oikopleura dioica]|uniref:Fucosyltransferase n=1 Tax=Oikopleura dioica TaxID=34765 RepID=A0ABN7RW73_OIKDI|nr:Oidioi.mRNA.OKI2018_I69.PAR.g11410.t1.cds [Oikopleura dioica]
MSEWRLARKSYKFDHPKISNKEAEETFRENLIEYEKEENPTTILNFWSGGLPRLQKISKHCGGCWLTNDKHVEYTADAIIFDHTRYRKNLEVETGVMPDFVNRNTDSQYWVFWPRESASKGIEKGTNHKLVKEIHDWDGAFNLTASCRLDSDAIRPYGNMNLLLKNYVGKSQEEIIQSIMAKKQYNNGKHTAWMVSNCDKTNGAVARWELGQQLIRSGLKLDGFGSCFDNNINGNPWQVKDLETEGAIGKYKFYLAFENSLHCNGYISEKFWRNSLLTGAVPVVYGPYRADLEAVAPKNSYIFVEDFSSPKELVDYLDYLDQNDTAYAEYHHWRSETEMERNGSMMTHDDEMICQLCQKINERKSLGYPKRMIRSVASWWWYNVHDEKCTEGFDLPKWITSYPPQTMEDTYDEMKGNLLEKSGPR